jgi:hypothetical protein
VKIRAALFVVVGLCGCRNLPDYPVPDQRPFFENVETRPSSLVKMSDPDASLHFFRDIVDGPPDSWRWTAQRPAVKVKLGFRDQAIYVIDFSIAGATFKDTGPVTIAFTVDDRVLDRVRYDAPGDKHFEKPVPIDWLEGRASAIVGAEIDKMWVAQTDGTRLGFILIRIGLREK